MSYILEWEIDGRIERAYMLPRVFEVQIEHSWPVERRLTMGRVPSLQYGRLRDIPITIRGRSGIVRRTGQDSAGNTLVAPGKELFHEFVDFLKEFQRFASDHQNAFVATRTCRLIFRAVDDRENHYVTIRSLPVTRSVSTSNFSYEYSVQLVTDGEADRPEVPSPVQEADALRAERLRDLDTSVDPAIAAVVDSGPTAGRQAAGVIPSARAGLLSEVQTFLDTANTQIGELSSEVESWRGPLQAVITAATSLRDIGSSLRDIAVEFPRGVVLDVTRAADLAATGIWSIWDGLSAVARSRTRPSLTSWLAPIQSLRNAALESLGRRGQKVDPDGGPAGATGGRRLTVHQGAIVVEYEVQPGETLAGIAEAILGDRGRWGEIAALNRLGDWASFANGAPIAQGGQTLLIPVPDGVALPADDGSLYGVDFALDGALELIATGDEPDGLGLVSGIGNVAQSVRVRSSTIQGQNSAFPLAGIRYDPDETVPVPLAVARARAQFLRDQRIAEIAEIDIQQAPVGRTLSLTVVPVVGAPLPATIPL